MRQAEGYPVHLYHRERSNRRTDPMEYSEMTLKEFTARLGCADPVPGGGGVVAHLTVGRRKYEPVREEMEQIILEEEALQDELLALIRMDAELFEPLSAAYSMPRGTQEEKDARDRVMKDALKDACQAPFQIMEKMCRALELCKTLAWKGSTAAVSDAGDAALFCKAALQGAALNVFINTKLMKDRVLAEEYQKRADRMLQEYVPVADRIYEKVLEEIH